MFIVYQHMVIDYDHEELVSGYFRLRMSPARVACTLS
jgi:hypothetical protein